MEELKAILIAHAKRYPLMQPRDAAKLIYQTNVFTKTQQESMKKTKRFKPDTA